MSSEPSDAANGSTFETWTRVTAEALSTAETARATVYVRSMLPPPGAKSRQDQVIERLESLAEDGVLDEVSIRVVGERLCLCEQCRATDAGASLVERMGELAAWGEQFGASTEPFFERRTTSSSVTGEHARAIVPPRVSVALSVDDRLAGVFPAQFSDGAVSVDDFLGSIEGTVERRAPAVET